MTASKIAKVHFFYNDRSPRLRNTTSLKHFIESIFKREKLKLNSINYVFCNDRSILQINRKYLNHDFYTDVITFDLSQKDEPTIAEVYISIDRVRENAKNLGVSISSEVHRVIFHAALHLAGYDDKKKEDRKAIRKKEDELLSRYFRM